MNVIQNDPDERHVPHIDSIRLRHGEIGWVFWPKIDATQRSKVTYTCLVTSRNCLLCDGVCCVVDRIVCSERVHLLDCLGFCLPFHHHVSHVFFA